MSIKKPYQAPDEGLIKKYGDRQGSFYTFYPMNGLWKDEAGASAYLEAIDEMIETRPDAPLSLYLHFPFCMKQCLFCHCFTVISGDKDDHGKFIDYMLKELEILQQHFDKRGFKPNFRELHFGGGSPSIISEDDFRRIWKALEPMLRAEDLYECTIEIDPRYEMSVDRMRFYHDMGVDRISFGVQDFNPNVGKIINRVNPPEMLEPLLTDEVRSMFKSINFDLIYGLPSQTSEDFKQTVQDAIRLNPDRLAVYVLGNRPDIYRHHQSFNKHYMAASIETSGMFVDAVNEFLENGYEFIGIDHMAKPTDVLAIAKKEGTLFRNAIGYTPGRSSDIIGVGPSSMGIVGDHYFQNYYTLPSYYEALDRDELPVVRGFVASDDDVLRREIMFDVVLYEKISKAKFRDQYGVENFDEYFAPELKELAEFVTDRLVEIDADEIRITDTGRFYQRQVCKVFDLYDREHGYTHSREFDDGTAALDRKVQLQT
ncbi:MAG: oxygen-independent coproporphyrinogen III oxidase [Rhodospirillaceae bacterium]|jgi:oxygen-independent coproporphyrinogen III oxidase|nr:oxygen-independent coproporphyrinogen III oxidase [Rhodospirillaceae bacterium]MBT4219088.1 oxygen-independent coproporphyrinogen III oxidase [Rhodospirillaceae bacterium]MBT4464077.1 oxygen-independent coproporphyrinogen III oxidase [Rhodospirillaceae bacterium]MBT5309519.1 oxygen-independent coproporphyrinogen III oxidase [Rhodospirillaceae bacterium]MBT7355346.1 oxygen-independent coproporphyrinogen III oxidase [Rhodospirillaceae bacterium]